MADKLISAEKLLDVMEINFCDGCDGFKYGRCSTWCPVTRMRSFIRLADSEAEPKHGRWEHYKTEILDDDIMGGEYRFKHFRCSGCRFDVGGNIGFRYCPNCGAKMDEVEE